MNFLIRAVQFIIILIPLIIFGRLVELQLAPTGEFEVSVSVNESSPFMDRLLPDARVLAPLKNSEGIWTQDIIADPVFFFVHPHRVFDELSFEVIFQNTGVPIVELGGLASKQPEVYALKPLQNLIIDHSDWNRLEKDGKILLQRYSEYESIDEFESNPPNRSRVTTYNVTLPQEFIIADYRARPDTQTINATLRGRHSLKTYIKNENLSFSFSYMDMNREEGIDAFVVTVFNQAGEPVAEAREEDDGNEGDNAEPSEMKTLEVLASGLPEGVYKLVINTTRDIFIRRVITPQQKVVFLNQVYLGDEVGFSKNPRSVELFTDGKRVSANTAHAQGVQTITFADSSMSIEEPYKSYHIETKENGVNRMYVPNGDVEIFSDSPVAFSREQFFAPDAHRLRFNSDLDSLGIDFVYAQYVSPVLRDGWFSASADFKTGALLYSDGALDENDFFIDTGAWKFAISVPGVEELNESVKIKEINLLFKGRAFQWRDLIRIFRK